MGPIGPWGGPIIGMGIGMGPGAGAGWAGGPLGGGTAAPAFLGGLSENKRIVHDITTTIL